MKAQVTRKVKLALATLLLAIAPVLVIATPAQASWSDCPIGTVCIFDLTSGGGAPYYWSSGSGCVNIGPSWNDRAGSLRNRAGSWSTVISFHEHANCSGDGSPLGLYTIAGEQYTFGAGSGYTQYNNMISSFYVHT